MGGGVCDGGQMNVHPYRIEARSLRVPGLWIPVITVPKKNRRDARRWLCAQGYRWIDTREWRVVPNP